MGKRKKLAADARKEVKKVTAIAELNKVPTSPRKMRLMADLIRGKQVELALNILKYSSKESSNRLEKLLRSAIANWQAKNEGARIEDSGLFVKTIFVDSGFQMKRIRSAPQGRAHRIRKRSNHVTIILDTKTSTN
jgi:large subunit ribosomal protein L22